MRGYIGLISVLFVGVIGTVVAMSILLLGIADSRTSFALVQSYQARSLADACAEEALQQIADSTSFSGIGTLTIGQGSCDYSVTKGTGQNRMIVTEGRVGTMVRRLSIDVTTINPQIVIGSWQEGT